MNCNFDAVYETGRALDSPEQAIALLKERYLAGTFPTADIDTCRIKVREAAAQPQGQTPPRSEDDINWKALAKRFQTRKVGKRTVYDLVFSVQSCGIDSYRFEVTSDGWYSLGGCCGK
jgi:hypothetical protein